MILAAVNVFMFAANTVSNQIYEKINAGSSYYTAWIRQHAGKGLE